MKSPEQPPNLNQDTNPVKNIDEELSAIPPQYEGLLSEVVEELWVDPIYADEEKISRKLKDDELQ